MSIFVFILFLMCTDTVGDQIVPSSNFWVMQVSHFCIINRMVISYYFPQQDWKWFFTRNRSDKISVQFSVLLNSFIYVRLLNTQLFEWRKQFIKKNIILEYTCDITRTISQTKDNNTKFIYRLAPCMVNGRWSSSSNYYHQINIIEIE